MKVVYDTCLYIDFFREKKYEDLFYNSRHIRYLSPIVLMELRVGAILPESLKGLEMLFHAYEKAERIIDLSSVVYLKAGTVLQRILKKNGSIKKGLSHDVLIAFSAISMGATLWTSNRSDFKMIQEHCPLKLEFL